MEPDPENSQNSGSPDDINAIHPANQNQNLNVGSNNNFDAIEYMDEDPEEDLEEEPEWKPEGDLDQDSDSEVSVLRRSRRILKKNQKQEAKVENEEAAAKGKTLRGTKKSSVMKPKKPQKSTVMKLAKETQTEYMRDQVNVDVNAIQDNTANEESNDGGERKNSFQVFGWFWLKLWNLLHP